MKLTFRQSMHLSRAVHELATIATDNSPVTVKVSISEIESVSLTLFADGEMHLHMTTYGTAVFKRFCDYEMYFLGK
jgi:hypothetical protein